jgi:hypothetical protein
MEKNREKDERLEGLDLKAIQEHAMEEELVRPRVEIWADPVYDEWTEWVRSHERKKLGNPVDICELVPGLKGSPLCPMGSH